MFQNNQIKTLSKHMLPVLSVLRENHTSIEAFEASLNNHTFFFFLLLAISASLVIRRRLPRQLPTRPSTLCRPHSSSSSAAGARSYH